MCAATTVELSHDIPGCIAFVGCSGESSNATYEGSRVTMAGGTSDWASLPFWAHHPLQQHQRGVAEVAEEEGSMQYSRPPPQGLERGWGWAGGREKADDGYQRWETIFK